MPFIPVDQMKKLREAAKNGDERAKKILKAQLGGQDYAADLDDYFKPAPETKIINNTGNPGSVTEVKATKGTGNAKLDAFLADNGVQEGDPDYEDAVNDYYNEFPNEMPEDYGQQKSEPVENQEQDAKIDEAARDLGKMLIDLIRACNDEMLEINQDEHIDDNAKKGAIVSLQEISQSMMENLDKVRKIKKSFTKEETGL